MNVFVPPSSGCIKQCCDLSVCLSVPPGLGVQRLGQATRAVWTVDPSGHTRRSAVITCFSTNGSPSLSYIKRTFYDCCSSLCHIMYKGVSYAICSVFVVVLLGTMLFFVNICLLCCRRMCLQCLDTVGLGIG